MSNSERIEELEAMIVHLVKRVEELEKTRRIAGYNTYLTELKREAQKLLKFK